MPLPSHNPDDPLNLGEVLRPAVEQIRRSPLPHEAVDRSVRRAVRIHIPSTPVRWTGRRKFVLLASAVAASVLFAVLSHVGSFPSVRFFARTNNDIPPNDRDALLVRLTPPPTWSPGSTPSPFNGGRVAVQGEQSERYLTIGMNELGSNWGDWERVQSPAPWRGPRPDDFRVQASWSPLDADVRLHLTDPEGKRLPVAEIESDTPGQPRRSQCCVIGQASQGIYVVEVSLGGSELPFLSVTTIKVRITLQGSTAPSHTHERIIELRHSGSRVQVARVGF